MRSHYPLLRIGGCVNSMRLFAAHRPKGAFLSYKIFNKPKGAYKKGKAVCACPLQGIMQGIMAAHKRKGAFFFAFKILLVRLIQIFDFKTAAWFPFGKQSRALPMRSQAAHTARAFLHAFKIENLNKLGCA